MSYRDPITPIFTHINKRLTAAEDDIRRLGGLGEQSQANYLTIDPVTGLIGAMFSGVISAQGVSLPASTSGLISNVNEVAWVLPGTITQVGNVGSSAIAGVEQVVLNSFATAAPDQSQIIFAACDDQGSPHGSVQVEQQNRGAFATIQLNLGGTVTTLIDTTRASNFVQTQSTNQITQQSSRPSFRYSAANHAIAVANSVQTVALDTVLFDPEGMAITNGFAAPSDGYYHIAGTVYLVNTSGGAISALGFLIADGQNYLIGRSDAIANGTAWGCSGSQVAHLGPTKQVFAGVLASAIPATLQGLVGGCGLQFQRIA